MPRQERFDAGGLWAWLEREERSVAWLARQCGWSAARIQSVKGGYRPATRKFAEKVAAALDVPFESLFTPLPPPEGKGDR
jgi:hypothetical protein